MTSANTPLELEMDLGSLASQAAIQLDDLLLGRSQQLGALRVLADKIIEGLPQDEPLDAATVVAVQRALVDTAGSVPSKTVSELQVRAAELSRKFLEIVGNTSQATMEQDLRQLRSFCVALSRHSAALQRSPYDWTEFPHQR